jgi:hypothetical protein
MDTLIFETIKNEILKMPGITTEPNRFGGIEFLVNKKMGHLHGDKLADLSFPIEVRKELVASGLAGLVIGSEIQIYHRLLVKYTAHFSIYHRLKHA